MIGKIVTCGVIPSGFVLKSKGVKESVYRDILETIASLKDNQAIDITSEELETKMAKKLPKFFRANLRKKLAEKFGKGRTEMVVMESAAGGKLLFHTEAGRRRRDACTCTSGLSLDSYIYKLVTVLPYRRALIHRALFCGTVRRMVSLYPSSQR